MTTGMIERSSEGSFLLELLQYAGWRLELGRDADGVVVRAVRDGVAVTAEGRSLAEAAGTIFGRAMRSRQRDRSRQLSPPPQQERRDRAA